MTVTLSVSMLEKIASAARATAVVLWTHGHARLKLEPGDATSYDITIVGPCERAVGPWAKDYMVAVNGRSYPWAGTFDLDGSYAAEKWGRDLEWTGEVVALFLNRVRRVLNEESA